MRIHVALAASTLVLTSACSTLTPSAANLDISPVERISRPLTPETAEMLMARGYYEQAAVAYQAALKSNPDDSAALYGLAESRRRSCKVNEAAADFELLAAAPEWKLRALEGLGRVALATGDRAGALEKFTRIVEEDPAAWRSWLAIAQLKDLVHDWAGADEAYALALASSKEHALVHNNHGVSMIARGQSAAAVNLFQSALAANPKLAPAATNLDLALAASGGQATADAAGGDARERARKLNNYGYVAMLQGRPEDAKRYYEAAIKEHPSFYALAFNNLKTLEGSEQRPQR
jgi:Flp pilus assembly protein TadD